jgi:hypothetical protein
MTGWHVFATEMPAMAAAGRELLYQFGPQAIALLATIRPDGGPRLHPVCPTLVDDRLLLGVVNASPKCRDLVRDGRYALHTLPGPVVDDELYLTGRALQAAADGIAACERGFARDDVHSADHTVFELDIETALWAQYRPRPSAEPPVYTRWRAPGT